MSKTMLRRILLVVCGVVLGMNLYMANARTLLGNELPMPLGYGTAVVLSGSMEPELSVNDLIFVKDTEEFYEGDIAVYQQGKELIVHRIIKKNGSQILLKGDANSVADEPVDRENLLGVVMFHIPGVGSIVKLLKTPVATILILVLAIMLVEKSNQKDRENDQKELEKIREEIRRLREE